MCVISDIDAVSTFWRFVKEFCRSQTAKMGEKQILVSIITKWSYCYQIKKCYYCLMKWQVWMCIFKVFLEARSVHRKMGSVKVLEVTLVMTVAYRFMDTDWTNSAKCLIIILFIFQPLSFDSHWLFWHLKLLCNLTWREKKL